MEEQTQHFVQRPRGSYWQLSMANFQKREHVWQKAYLEVSFFLCVHVGPLCQCRGRQADWRRAEGLPLLCLCCKCTRLHLQKIVKWMKAAIFLSVVLTFVFVYDVELIVLMAFQTSPRLFPVSFISPSSNNRIQCNHSAGYNRSLFAPLILPLVF